MATPPTKTQKLSFQWNIKKFDDCDLVSDEFFDSPQFSITVTTFVSDWKLRLYPAGSNFPKEQKNLTLLLLRLGSGPIFYTKHSISLLNRNGGRFHTENCTILCQPSKYTDSTEMQMRAANIMEVKQNVKKFLDDGVLSILFEIEIYDKNYGMQAAVPEKQIQMLATSSVIQSKQNTHVLEFKMGKKKSFWLSYGKLCVGFEGIVDAQFDMVFEISDNDYPEIKDVPVRIIDGERGTYWKNIKRSSTTVRPLRHRAKYSLEISARCMILSPPYAFPIVLTPCIRKVHADFRNMFLKSDFGDISIVIGKKSLRAHKDILRNRCPVFAAMFSQEWRENTIQSVTIREFDFKTMQALIEYIYYGGDDEGENELSAADPAELLKAAHMYMLDDLKSKCELRMCKSLDRDNVYRYMLIVETYDLQSLKTAIFQYMKNNEIIY